MQYTVLRIDNISLYFFPCTSLLPTQICNHAEKSLARSPLVVTPHGSSLSVQGLTTTLAVRDPPSDTQTKPSHYTVGTAEAAAVSTSSCAFCAAPKPADVPGNPPRVEGSYMFEHIESLRVGVCLCRTFKKQNTVTFCEAFPAVEIQQALIKAT